MRQCAHERHLAEVLWQENKPLGISLHGRMRFVSPFCGMSKKRNRKRAVAAHDKENRLNEKRKRRLEGKPRESEKSGRSPERFSGRLRFALVFCSPCPFNGVCLSAARRSRAALVYDKHTPWCQSCIIGNLFLRSQRFSFNLHCVVI